MRPGGRVSTLRRALDRPADFADLADSAPSFLIERPMTDFSGLDDDVALHERDGGKDGQEATWR